MRSGRLVAVKFVKVRDKNAYWECICDCGNKVIVRLDKIKYKRKKHCGECKPYIIDISGYKCKMLTVIDFAHSDSGVQYWNCLCECGNKIKANRDVLVCKSIVSCGCHRIKNIAGQRFGRLVAVEYSHTNNRGSANWKCICDCGSEKTILGRSLWGGMTKSCGCWKHVKQDFIAKIVSNILQRNYESDYRQLNWLKNPDTNRNLEIDIYFPEIKLAIEYNGEYHFDNKRFSKEKTDRQKKRDKIKLDLISNHIYDGSKDINKFIIFSCQEDISEEYIVEKLICNGVING